MQKLWHKKLLNKNKTILKKLEYTKQIFKDKKGSLKISKRYKKYIIGKIVRDEKGNDTETRLKHNFGMAHPEGYRLAHTMIRVKDLEASFNFYCKTLGMKHFKQRKKYFQMILQKTNINLQQGSKKCNGNKMPVCLVEK